MSRNNPRVLDRFQQARANQNAMLANAQRLDSAKSNPKLMAFYLANPVAPFLTGIPAWRGAKVFGTREQYSRAHSKYPNPVPPSKQHRANGRRLARMSVAA